MIFCPFSLVTIIEPYFALLIPHLFGHLYYKKPMQKLVVVMNRSDMGLPMMSFRLFLWDLVSTKSFQQTLDMRSKINAGILLNRQMKEVFRWF